MEFLLTFLEGIASFISPCMIHLIPIYISFFAGREEKSTKSAVINSIGFVLGFTIVFVGLSILASIAGITLIENMKYIKIALGVIVIILGLNYIGIINLAFLNKSHSTKYKPKELNFFKSLLFGIGFTIGWTPCIGPFLGSALTLVVQSNSLLKGILLMLTYSIGLGIPFILSSFLIDKLKRVFDFFKKHSEIIRKISGIVLIIMGIYTMFE